MMSQYILPRGIYIGTFLFLRYDKRVCDFSSNWNKEMFISTFSERITSKMNCFQSFRRRNNEINCSGGIGNSVGRPYRARLTLSLRNFVLFGRCSEKRIVQSVIRGNGKLLTTGSLKLFENLRDPLSVPVLRTRGRLSIGRLPADNTCLGEKLIDHFRHYPSKNDSNLVSSARSFCDSRLELSRDDVSTILLLLPLSCFTPLSRIFYTWRLCTYDYWCWCCCWCY